MNLNCHNYSIDFLRFIFCIMIVYLHLTDMCLPMLTKIFNNSTYMGGFALCVEAFFIMAGYFLFLSNKDIKKFILARILRLWPLLFFSVILTGIMRLFHLTNLSLGKWDLYNLFFLQGTGIYQGCATNGCAWFVGVLFWVSIFYFVIKKLFRFKAAFIFCTSIILSAFFLLWYPKSDLIFTDARGFCPIVGGGEYSFHYDVEGNYCNRNWRYFGNNSTKFYFKNNN